MEKAPGPPKEDVPAAKRARTSNDPANPDADTALPLVIQLILPFVKAGNLGNLAAANRACRVAAIASYQKRLVTPRSIKHALVHNKEEDPQALKTMRPSIFEEPDGHAKVPICYQKGNPWSHLDYIPHRRQPGTPSLSAAILTRDSENENWDVKWRSNAMEWQEGVLHRPTELDPLRHVRVGHCSLRGSSLLMIVSKKLSISGETNVDEDDYSEDEDTGRDLWGILYDMEKRNEDGSFHPILSKKLLSEPKGIEWAANNEVVEFGTACRSGNGKVVAVVTALPRMEYLDGEPAAVTVFEMKDHGFEERCTISVATFNSTTYHSGIQPSLSTGGDVLSILNEGTRPDEVGWAVYDIRGKDPQQILQFKGFARTRNYAYFTPDDDFVMHVALINDSKIIKTKEDFPCFAGQLICHMS